MEWQSSGCYRQATRVNLRFRCLCTFRYAPKSVLHGYKEPLVRGILAGGFLCAQSFI